MDESQRGRATHASRAWSGLEPVRFLLGEWEGEGFDFEGTVRARSSGVALLDGTWIRMHDRLLSPTGELLYEDYSLYRFDPVEDHLMVIHMMSMGHRREYPVRATEDGLSWITGPFGPKVEILKTANGWRSRVTLSGEQTPGLDVEYRRLLGQGDKEPDT